MEVQDGFIVGIFNYCDRWCETCSFTSRCRLFADSARHDAAIDPSLKELIDAPPHPRDVREPPRWQVEAIEEMNEATRAAVSTLASASLSELTTALPAPHSDISARANEYAIGVHKWWQAEYREVRASVIDPRFVILWFSTLIGSKVYRALVGLAEDDGDREFPPDHEGSAKVALIGIDRSETAWRDLVAIERVTADDAAPFLCELSWLRESLETLLPNARAFVRPGLDEPDEVKMLDAAEC